MYLQSDLVDKVDMRCYNRKRKSFDIGESMGNFIVFEGIDGSGKSTQIKLLASKLRESGRRVYVTAEPTESVSGGLLRDALCGISKRTPCEMAALFTLDRIYHNVNPVNGIKKMLADGFDVICDRYYYSTLAYQGNETDPEWVRCMNIDCPEIMRPDLCVFLDVTPEVGLSRVTNGERGFTEIYEKSSILDAVRKKYFDVFDRLPCEENVKVINADRAPEQVADEVFSEVIKL